MLKFLCFSLLVTLPTVYCATPVRSCNNGASLPLVTQVNDCEAMPCELPQGSTASLNAIFESITYTSATRPRVLATALGLQVNYPLDQTNGCDGFQNIECPIAEGDLVDYVLEMPVLSIYPKVALELEFSLFDENDIEIFCFIVDAQVV